MIAAEAVVLRININVGLMQAMDFLSLCRSFFAPAGKNDLHKKESTMLPQAKVAAFPFGKLASSLIRK
jgi:hypothetical protein